MIVACGIGDAEAHYDFVQEWRRVENPLLGPMVVSGAELKLVGAWLQLGTLQQWLRSATVGIGGCGMQQSASIMVADIQADRDAGGWFAAGGIEYMSG